MMMGALLLGGAAPAEAAQLFHVCGDTPGFCPNPQMTGLGCKVPEVIGKSTGNRADVLKSRGCASARLLYHIPKFR